MLTVRFSQDCKAQAGRNPSGGPCAGILGENPQAALPAALVSSRGNGEETDALGREFHDARLNGCRLQVGKLAVVIQLSLLTIHLDVRVLQTLRREGVPLCRDVQVKRLGVRLLLIARRATPPGVLRRQCA